MLHCITDIHENKNHVLSLILHCGDSLGKPLKKERLSVVYGKSTLIILLFNSDI